MDIRNLSKHGSVDRSLDRPVRSDAKLKDVVIPAPPRDEAKISEASREAASLVETFAERARRDGSGREEVVAAALAKLKSGELDSDASLSASAQKLLAGKFLSA